MTTKATELPDGIVQNNALRSILDGSATTVPIDTTIEAPLGETVPTVTATLVVDSKCSLAEGILYDHQRHALLYTDILGKAFYKINLGTGKGTRFDLSKQLCSFAMLQDRDGYLCAWNDGFELYDLEKAARLMPDPPTVLEGSATPPYPTVELPSAVGVRLNDGRVDRTGKHFVCGAFYGNNPGVTIKVYSVQAASDKSAATTATKASCSGDGLVYHEIMDNVRVTNGLCFSKDGNSMYFADSPTQEIYRFDYQDGGVNHETKDLIFSTAKPNESDAPKAEEEEEDGGKERDAEGTPYKTDISVPDGSIVDSDGMIWNAVWREGDYPAPGYIRRIDPNTGKVVFRVNVPDATSQVSCCCFGGKDLDVLFITTAGEWIDRTKQPNAGGIYAIKLPFKGMKENRFVL